MTSSCARTPRKLIISLLILSLLFGTGLPSSCRARPVVGDTPAVPAVVTSQALPSLTVPPPAETPLPLATLAAGGLNGLVAEVDRERALGTLRKLTGDEPVCISDGCHTIQNRATGSQGLGWAKEYVYQELVSLGYSVEVQDWSREGYSDQNLVARRMGVNSPGDEIYFVAHLDGYQPDGVERSPAADDDATGVAALLEVARVLGSRPLANTLVLLITTGEEHGALGAESYVKRLSSNELSAIRYAVSVEMLGYDSNNDGVMQLWGGDHAPSQAFAGELNGILVASGLKLTPQIVTGCD